MWASSVGQKLNGWGWKNSIRNKCTYPYLRWYGEFHLWHLCIVPVNGGGGITSDHTDFPSLPRLRKFGREKNDLGATQRKTEFFSQN